MASPWRNKIVFKTEGKDFRFKDIVGVFKKAGIKNGDVLMINADLGRFGKLGEITNKEEFADIFIEAFKQVVGEGGTLVTPTFTYSFCNNEIYDPDSTPSKVGLFTEQLRKRKGSFRSIHPIFSVAAVGKRAEELTTNLSKKSFGKGSVYDKLQRIKNSKYVIFGVDYFACTQIHYIEEILKAPYRYVKKFKGKIRKGKKVYNDEYEFYVRRLDGKVVPDFSKIEKHLLDAGFLKKVPFGYDYISIAKISDICREGVKMFKKDPNFFLKNTEMFSFEKLPFYIGVLDSPDNKGLPLVLPFALDFDKDLGLIVQRYSRENEKMLNSAYKKGSSVSTPLGQGSLSVSRADDVLKYLVKICPCLRKSSFLEVGCGDGYLLWRLKLLGAKEVTGCDPGTDAKQGKKRFGIDIINDFYKSDLFDEKFDVIFSFGFLEHVRNPLETVESFRRIMKQKGKIFIAVPNCENKLKLGDISILGHEHWNFFTAEALKNILVKSGFSDVETALGSKNAMIYGWGNMSSKIKKIKNKDIESNTELLFHNFSAKINKILPCLQEKIDKLDRENKSLGLYAGGLQIIGLLKHKLEPRFFNGDTANHGKYFPGYKNPIENPKNLLENKVDELWIMATDYDREIIDYLKNNLKIPKDIKIFSFKNYLENFK